MSEQETQELTFRDALKTLTEDDVLKMYNKDALIAEAQALGVEDVSGTKAEILARAVKAADLPDPALRGTSEIDNPVAHVWAKADAMFAEARKKGEADPRRKDVVAACEADGVAHYTARTQYQAWYTHTNKGEKLIADGNTDDLPRSVAGEFGVVQETEEETEA